MSAISLAQSFKNLPGTLSGPIALLGLRLDNNFKMPRELILMGLRVGSLSFSSKLAWILGDGFEKTESNCWWIRWAFSTGSLVRMLFLFLKSEMPELSCFLLLMYDHSFLFEESLEKMSFKKLSWVCLQVLWHSLLIFL